MAVVSRGGIDGLLQRIHPFDVFPIRRRLRVTRDEPCEPIVMSGFGDTTVLPPSLLTAQTGAMSVLSGS